jgi:hypothetical protein
MKIQWKCRAPLFCGLLLASGVYPAIADPHYDIGVTPPVSSDAEPTYDFLKHDAESRATDAQMMRDEAERRDLQERSEQREKEQAIEEEHRLWQIDHDRWLLFHHGWLVEHDSAPNRKNDVK